MKVTARYVLWGLAIAVGAAVYLLDAMEAFPRWFEGGPVVVGIAGVALLADRLLFSGRIKGGFVIPLLLVGVSAGTVLQDAQLLVNEYSIWPPLLGALVLALIMNTFSRRTG